MTKTLGRVPWWGWGVLILPIVFLAAAQFAWVKRHEMPVPSRMGFHLESAGPVGSIQCDKAEARNGHARLVPARMEVWRRDGREVERAVVWQFGGKTISVVFVDGDYRGFLDTDMDGYWESRFSGHVGDGRPASDLYRRVKGCRGDGWFR